MSDIKGQLAREAEEAEERRERVGYDAPFHASTRPPRSPAPGAAKQAGIATRPGLSDLLGRRALAIVIDVVILSVIQIVLGNVYGVERVTGRAALQPGAMGFATYTVSNALDWRWLVAISLTYFVVMERLFGATVGKLVLGLRVVSAASGGPASWRAIVGRNVLRFVDALPVLYLLGGISVLLTERHQRLGDVVARTLVAPRAAGPADRIRRRKVAALLALVVAGTAFTAAFDYLGRPPLVIQGVFNTGRLDPVEGRITGYELGPATFEPGRVTYAIRYRRAGQSDCSGELRLRWQGFLSGWTMDSAETRC